MRRKGKRRERKEERREEKRGEKKKDRKKKKERREIKGNAAAPGLGFIGERDSASRLGHFLAF
jgi:hypothetical protein